MDSGRPPLTAGKYVITVDLSHIIWHAQIILKSITFMGGSYSVFTYFTESFSLNSSKTTDICEKPFRKISERTVVILQAVLLWNYEQNFIRLGYMCGCIKMYA